MLVSCGQKQDKVERIFEDGVEVILNHIEPYKIQGESTNFTLAKELFIDFARDDIGEMGIANATHQILCIQNEVGVTSLYQLIGK